MRLVISVLAIVFTLGCAGSQSTLQSAAAVAERDPLPAWNDTETKRRIIDFVRAVSETGSPSFVPPEERIATFDNDGTLWVEQPLYAQLAFAIDRVKALAPEHPEWKRTQPFKALLEGDRDALLAAGTKGLVDLVTASHAGMSTEAFEAIAVQWLEQAMHPRFKRRYTELVYEPQIELLRYLRANGFKTFIVSGGGVEFMRPWTERVYGIPPEQVVGSSIETQFEIEKGVPTLNRLPKVHFYDDKAGKPIAINRHIGRRPVLAFGNSDGDFEMLQWTTGSANGSRLGLILHHDDAEREYAYDRESHVGKLDRGLDAAESQGWVVVSMKDDWATVFAP